MQWPIGAKGTLAPRRRVGAWHKQWRKHPYDASNSPALPDSPLAARGHARLETVVVGRLSPTERRWSVHG